MAFFSGNNLPKMSITAASRRRQPVMNDLYKTAYQRGFVKAALEAGYTEGQAVDFCKKAFGQLSDQGYQNLFDSTAAGGLEGSLMGGGIGAAGGGLAGYLGGQNKQDPQNDHRYRDAILGALAGGGLGATAGGLGNAAHQGIKAMNAPGNQASAIDKLMQKMQGMQPPR